MDVYELDARLRGLTPHQLKIVESVYHANGEWLTRAQVAKSLGKRRLTPYDINCLQILTERGIINMSTQPTTAPGSDFAYIYNMDDDLAQVLQEWVRLREEMRNDQTNKRRPINLVPDNQ